jgi:hypothetical protein
MREKFSAPFLVLVDDIKLDIQNFRYYGELSNQKDCIEAMLNDPKSGVIELASDIAQYGLTPDPIVISKDDSGEWVVREGNRRIAALKLLNNPSTARDKMAKNRINNIVKKFEDRVPDTIECISSDDEICVLDYLDRVHTGFRNGTGRRGWSPENKAQFNMHIGKPAENALAIKVKNMVKDEGVELKEPYYITNLQRVLQNTKVQSRLGFSWDGEKITAAVNKKTLMAVLKEIALRTGNKKVQEIYVGDQQLEFVDDVLTDLKIDMNSAKTDTYELGENDKGKGVTGFKKGRLKLKPSWDRKRLIPPRNTNLIIPDLPENVKVGNVANELARKIDVREAPNAAAVLLRVLLELSVKRYIADHNLTENNTLASGIRSVAEHMGRSGKIRDEYKEEVIKTSDNQNLLSARTLQRYIHSFNFNPDRQTLCVIWDNLDLFVAKCWK